MYDRVLIPGTHSGQKRALESSPIIGVMDGCEPPSECWELDPGPLQEQPVLLTVELSL